MRDTVRRFRVSPLQAVGATTVGDMSLKRAVATTAAASVPGDDCVSLLTPDDYIELRLKPELERCYVRCEGQHALATAARVLVPETGRRSSARADARLCGPCAQDASQYNSRVVRVGTILTTILAAVGTILAAMDFRIFVVRVPSPTRLTTCGAAQASTSSSDIVSHALRPPRRR